MRKCLNSIHKALAEQNESFQDHAARTDAMHLMLGKALDGLRPASKTDSVVSGHLGAMTKLCRLHKEACDKAKELHTAVHAQLHKSADAIASQLGISLAVGNANSSDGSFDTDHQGENTTSAGAISHGKSYTAPEQVALAKSLSTPTLFSKVQGFVNQRPNQTLAKSLDGGWKEAPDLSAHPRRTRARSEFEKRHPFGQGFGSVNARR